MEYRIHITLGGSLLVHISRTGQWKTDAEHVASFPSPIYGPKMGCDPRELPAFKVFLIGARMTGDAVFDLDTGKYLMPEPDQANPTVSVVVQHTDNGRGGTDTSPVGVHLVREVAEAEANRLQGDSQPDDVAYEVEDVRVITRPR